MTNRIMELERVGSIESTINNRRLPIIAQCDNETLFTLTMLARNAHNDNASDKKGQSSNNLIL